MFKNGNLGRHRLSCVARICGAGILTGVGLTLAGGATAQQFSVEVRGPDPKNDYLTWAPAKARICQLPGPNAIDNRRVVLTNDAERSPPVPPLDGNVAFDNSVPQGATATKATLELVLPKNGCVDFVVAGSRASTEDKDTVIEVHDGSASGPVVHTHRVMVRIRKDHRELTVKERSRYLNAVAALHKQNRYEWFLRIHEQTSKGFRNRAPVYYWPDVAHKGSAFLAWHRAFLLLFERALQEMDPSVALPYWRIDTLPTVFTEDFMGANTTVSTALVQPTFGSDPADSTKPHPLNGWRIRGVVLYRFPHDRNVLLREFKNDDELLKLSVYRTFSRIVEGAPHDNGHDWTGPWMRNCQISPSDPVFWIFHAGFDRQWAEWQRKYGRFEPDGSKDSYLPNDAFNASATGCDVEDPSGCMALGHHLKDTMWPWDSKVDAGTVPKANRPPSADSTDLIGAFPKSSIVKLWPSGPAMPTPGDMIDYAGTRPNRLDMGFAYDKIEYGPAPSTPAVASAPPNAVALRTFTDRRVPISERVGALTEVSDTLDAENSSALVGIVSDQSEPEPVRIGALRHLASLRDGKVVPPALAVLKGNSSAELGAAAVHALTMQMMFGDIGEHAHHEIMDALRAALSNPEPAIRTEALRTLASHRDPVLVDKLAAVLQQPVGQAISVEDALSGLAVAGASGQHAARIQPYLTNPRPEIKVAALAALPPDNQSRPVIAGLLADAAQPYEVRSAALLALSAGQAGQAENVSSVLAVLKNATESTRLRQEAAHSLATIVEASGQQLTKPQLDGLARELRTLGEPSIAPSVTRTLRATESQLEKQ